MLNKKNLEKFYKSIQSLKNSSKLSLMRSKVLKNESDHKPDKEE